MRASNRLLTDVDRNWATSRGEEEKRAPWQGYNKRSGSGWYTWTPPEKTSIDQIRSLSRPQQLTISRLGANAPTDSPQQPKQGFSTSWKPSSSFPLFFYHTARWSVRLRAHKAETWKQGQLQALVDC